MKLEDLHIGTSRQWVIGRDGVKRWADNGQPLTQELLNSMMREPGEAKRSAAPALPSCPQCGERYCGDGVQLCTECAAPNVEFSGGPLGISTTKDGRGPSAATPG